MIDSPTLIAQLTGIADTVGGPLQTAFGGGGAGANAIVNLGIFFYQRFLLIIDIIAAIMIVRSGLRLIYRPEEEELARSKRVIASAIAAVMLAHLTPRFVASFYGTGVAVFPPVSGACILANEIYGLVRWGEVLVATVAVIMIILSGIRTVTSYGNEEGITQLKSTVIAVIAGSLVIVSSAAIRAALGLTTACGAPGAPDAIPIVARIVGIVSGLLSFLALVAVCMGVYAGIMMIANFGSEEEFTKAKTLLFRMVVGLLVVLISLALVEFVVAIF